MPGAADGALSGGQQGLSMGAAAGPWGALAGGVIGAAAGWWLGDKAAEAKKAAALEQLRRQDLQRAQISGQAEAAVGASGVEFGSGSMQTYLATMGAEFQRQHDWSYKQAMSAADIGESASALQGLAGIGSSLFNFGAANKWWQSSPGPRVNPYSGG